MATLLDRLRNWFFEPLLNTMQNERFSQIETARNYRVGVQKKQLKVRAGKADDNLVLNFTGLIIDRQVSDLYGGGVIFTVDGDNQQAQDYLNALWDENKKDILLYRAGIYGSESGTVFVKVLEGEEVPRLVLIDPALINVETDPEDMGIVRRFMIQYVIVVNGKEQGRRQVIEKAESGIGWSITDWITNGRKWEQVTPPVYWGYSLPPVIYWQNLPSNEVYGDPDITADVIELQDRLNFIASNTSKVIRYHAHPKTIGKGLSAKQFNESQAEGGPDDLIFLPGEMSDMKNLEMQSDLASSMAFMTILRQSLFDITRTVDTDSLADKLGALTNFGLRVLNKDALQKIATKRELYGEGLEQLNTLLLEMGGFSGITVTVKWGEVLPANELEQITALKSDLEIGVVSHQTVSEKRGYEWKTEQERIAGEKVGELNIGAELLRGFNAGRGGQ